MRDKPYYEKGQPLPVGTTKCPRCSGKGWEYVPYGDDDVTGDTCYACEGTGLKFMIDEI